jgi:hypothetical protein
MKKIILIAMTLIFSASTFGQQVNPSPGLTRDYYLQKSKKKKKTGTILLAGGATLVLAGVLIPKGDEKGTSYTLYGLVPYTDYENDGIKAALALTGITAMLVSIPFFIASGKNKRKAQALTASIKTDDASIIQGYGFTRINYPALSIKIAL